MNEYKCVYTYERDGTSQESQIEGHLYTDTGVNLKTFPGPTSPSSGPLTKSGRGSKILQRGSKSQSGRKVGAREPSKAKAKAEE